MMAGMWEPRTEPRNLALSLATTLNLCTGKEQVNIIINDDKIL